MLLPGVGREARAWTGGHGRAVPGRDDFEDVSGWHAITSGQAQLHISQAQGRRGKAMRLDFDFQGGGGFVVAHKPFALALSESYAFCFHIRGSAPSNIFEFKLVDASGLNVWRYRQEARPPRGLAALTIKSSQIEFSAPVPPRDGMALRTLMRCSACQSAHT